MDLKRPGGFFDFTSGPPFWLVTGSDAVQRALVAVERQSTGNPEFAGGYAPGAHPVRKFYPGAAPGSLENNHMFKVMSHVDGEGPGRMNGITKIEFLTPDAGDILELLLERIGIDASDFEELFPHYDADKIVEGVCAEILKELVISSAHALKDESGSNLKPNNWERLPEHIRRQMDAAWKEFGDEPRLEVDPEGWPVYDRIVDYASGLGEVRGGSLISTGLGEAARPQPA